MDSYTMAEIVSVVAIVGVALLARAVGFHLWAGLIALTAASVLASYTFSWLSAIEWLSWLALLAVTVVGLVKVIRREALKRE